MRLQGGWGWCVSCGMRRFAWLRAQYLPAFAAPSVRAMEPARAANVEQKMRQETEHLSASRFERVGDGTIEMVGKNESAIVSVQFEARTVYAIVAACGEGCDHVEIALFDPSQNLLHRSPETSDV